MASIGSQKINATKNNTLEAGKRFTEIRDIINKNSDMPFKDVIREIADITAGSFYNYTSPNSKKYGSVSLFTVENMSHYFNLPQGIFDCSQTFDEDSKRIIEEKIRTNFKNKIVNVKKNVVDQLKQLAQILSTSTDFEELNEALNILQSIEVITKNRIDIMNSLNSLK